MLLEAYSWVELGGVRLAGAPDVVPFTGLMVSSIPGWRGLSGARGESDPVPGEQGSYPTAGGLLREERSMVLNGAAIAPTAGAAAEMLDVLEAAVAGALVPMRVSDETGVWSRDVLVEALTPQEKWNRARVRFSIDLIAPDPVRYRDVVVLGPVGLPVREGGLVLPASMPWDLGTDVRSVLPVSNEGSVPVYPVVRLSGSASSVAVLGGPRRLGFGAFDGRLVFDAADRRAFLNGADVTRQMTRRDWPMVPAGATHEFTFEAVSPSPDFRMSVEYRIGAW